MVQPSVAVTLIEAEGGPAVAECPEIAVDINHLRHSQIFHYLAPAAEPAPRLGMRVLVPLGNKTVLGWVVGYSAPPEGIALRSILSVVGQEPDFNPELLSLARWMAEYYLHPLSEMLKMIAPPPKPLLNRKRTPSEGMNVTGNHGRLLLSGEQATALKEIDLALQAGAGGKFLLHGITGSGKTEVYLRSAMTALALGHQVLYLVPEIALTPQAGAWFRSALGAQVAIWHGRLARGEKYETWAGIRQGRLNILIGPRSAVFAPFKSLGLIIIDEEQDSSYKQQESPYYHAGQVAARRALYNRAVVLMGSATPSLESYTAARSGQYRLLHLTRRPRGRQLPRVTIVDLKTERQAQFSLLSQSLSGKIAQRLQRQEQVILLLNRRGYSPIVFCPLCGHVLKCERCSVSLVYHRHAGDLRCHYCNFRRFLPASCPGCGAGKSLRFLGTGIQRVEHLLKRLYPEARIQRLDFDTTRRKGDFDRILAGFGGGQIDILLGTQMVAKGHDFPGVTLVGVLNADLALGLPDFRSTERTYQLLAQVAGRAGRGRVPGEVVVQTYWPDHYSIRAACSGSYASFYQEEIKNRAFAGYPPFGELIRVRVSGTKEQQVIDRATELAEDLTSLLTGQGVQLLGPAPAPVLRLKEQFRWQLMLKGEFNTLRDQIRDCIHRYQKNTSVIISIEVDPYGF